METHDYSTEIEGPEWVDAVRQSLREIAEREQFEFKRTAKPLRQAFLRQRHSLHGCTEPELIAIERQFDLELPGEYRRFLRRLGRGCRILFEDCDIAPQLLPSLQLELRDTLEACDDPFPLESAAFVICARNGAEFWWIPTDGTEDPPVYHWRDWDPSPVVASTTFRGFIEQALSRADQRIRREGTRAVAIQRDATGALQIRPSTSSKLAG